MSNITTFPVTIVTGLPGAGKSALMVKLLKEAHDAGRPLFVNGIPDLQLEHQEVPPIEEWTERRVDPATGQEMAYFRFPENALVCSDEAQRIFRPRPTGSKVPDHIAAFETIRHTGITFLCGTQHPNFIDSHIRKLTGCHVHLRDLGVLGRWYYEWPECGNPDNATSAPIKKRFKLPKSVFKLYKSSSLHIKRSYNIPPAVVLIGACLLVIALIGWYIFGRISDVSSPATNAPSQPAVTAPTAPESRAMAHSPEPASDPAAYLASFVPTVPGRPETAPAYAHLLQVKDFPRVVAGFCKADQCTCYTQQATKVLDSMQCREWLENPQFDPYREPQLVQSAAPSENTAALESQTSDSNKPSAPTRAREGTRSGSV